VNRITCDFPSDSLKTLSRVIVLLPKNRPSPFDMGTAPVYKEYPTLYLLHGAFEDAQQWLWHTELTDLVDSLGMAVVLPNGHNSFYLDDDGGMRYHAYITEELPSYLRTILPLSPKREENFIGGFSMGGYGAVYAALKKPEQYGKVFSMSGSLDICMSSGFTKTCGGVLPTCLRNRKALRGSEYDLVTMVDGAAADRIPPMLLTCGEQDYFLRATKAFYEKAHRNGLPVSLQIGQGDHNWVYWRECLPQCLRWLLTD